MSSLPSRSVPRLLFWAALLLLDGPALPAQQAEHVVSAGGGLAAETAHALARHGIGLQYQYVQDLSKAPMGTQGDHAWFSRYTWDLCATLDGGKSVGWSGGSALIDLKQHMQEFGRMYDGVAQGYSNLDTNSYTTLYAAWAQQSLLRDHLRVKGGIVDANTDFDAVATAADFLNSSMGYSPTIMEFPSYPKPMPGIDVAASFGRGTSVRAGEFATIDGRISIVEAAQVWAAGKSGMGGRVSFGAWKLRAPLSRFDGGSAAATAGLYSVVEQTLWSQGSEAGGMERSISAFLQVGTGNGQENPITRHAGGGVVWAAPFRRRPGDALGVASTWVRIMDSSQSPLRSHGELVVESYYKLQLTRSLSLISDVQYFHHPGGEQGRPDAFFATPRLVMTF